MKVKIVRKIEPNGKCWFNVKSVMPSGEETHMQSFSFKIGEPEDSIWNEEKNFADALAIAHRLETEIAIPEETVVYETPVEEASQIEIDKSISELT